MGGRTLYCSVEGITLPAMHNTSRDACRDQAAKDFRKLRISRFWLKTADPIHISRLGDPELVTGFGQFPV